MGSLVASIDVEDWPQSTWDRSLEITPRAEANTLRLLDLLARSGKKATLFVLGKYAQRFPQSVRRMADEGHEVASHGYGHVEIFKQDRCEFKADVAHSRALLEDLTGRPIIGYRAPDFSIVEESLWALDELAELGFQYDSSIFPRRMARYGIEGWPDDPVVVRLRNGLSITELPIATLDYRGRRLPVGGGGYHRLLPWPLIRAAVRRRLADHDLFMAYCHPYEFDPAEFSSLNLPIPLKTRLHQGLGRRGFAAKFDRLLNGFPTITAGAAAARDWPEYRPRYAALDAAAAARVAPL